VNALFEFCLAHAAEREGIQVHAYVTIRNHYHLHLTDPEGRLPEFMKWLDSMLARLLNRFWGRKEAFWAPGPYSAVRLETSDDVFSKLLYLYVNPVAARLVKRLRHWPGARSLPSDFGVERPIPRPDGFFSARGNVPKSCSLKLTCPPGVDPAALQRALTEFEDSIRSDVEAKGDGFLGRRAAMQQSPHSAPAKSAEETGINPRIAARDRRVRIRAIQRWKDFLTSYREALEQYLDGHYTVEFPAGTYLMRVRFGVNCASP
jgi:hypothetical protein